MQKYIQWNRTNNLTFHDSFEMDVARVKLNFYVRWASALGGVVFGATVINPNFTRRRSYYMRKLVPLMTGLVAYQYAYRCSNIHMTSMLMRMHEYMPMEVKRTMATKDYRHVAMFVEEQEQNGPTRELFCPSTGKSLS